MAILALAASVWVNQPAVAAAGIDKTINFQGKVVNTDGTNVVNGSYSFTFNFYTVGTAGTSVWTETKSLTVTDGIFQTELGDTTALPGSVDFNTDNIFLGIEYNGDGEMSPRIHLTASPYAFNSDLLDGLDAAAFAQLSPASAQTGSLNVTGSVQAATSLQAPLVDTATGVALSVGTGTATSVTIGRTSTPYLLQGNASSTFTATDSGNTTTVGFIAPTGANAINFPDAGGTICTTTASTCSATYQVSGTYLAKNASDTSSFAVTAANYLYSFTNSSSAVASGVLSLDNGTNTSSALDVTAAANAASGKALIEVTNTNGTPGGNLIDLRVTAGSRFSVDAAGAVSTSSTINGQTISAAANFTGTVTAATSLLAPLLDTASAGALAVGTTFATAINLNQNTTVASGKSLTAQGNVTVGTAGSTTLFKNNGATQNTVCAYTGVSGATTLNTVGKTPDDCTSFTIETSGPATLTIPAPAAGAGSILYINNLSTSTSSVTVLGSALPVGNSEVLVYDGVSWTTSASASAGSVTLQNAYNFSAGASPSILATSANAAVTVQSAISSGIVAGAEIFGVHAAHSSDTLGDSILSATSYGLGINLGADPAVSGSDLQFGGNADRVISVISATTANQIGGALSVKAGNANGSTTGAVGGALNLFGGNAAGTGNNAGGAVLVQGGTSTGTGAGGTANLKGGTASSTGAGGLVVISAAAGGTAAASGNGAGGSITLTAGSALLNNNDGGSITLTAGTRSGSGTPGIVSIGSPVFTSVSQTFTQTGNGQAFPAAGAETTTLQSNLDTYGTIVMNVTGAFTGSTVTMPSPTNASSGRVVYVSAATGSVSFTLAATGMSSVNMSSGNTATLVWNGSSWSGTTTASSLQQVYNNTSTSPASIITTSASKNILLQAGVGFDNANVFQVGNSASAPVIAIDTTNTATGANLANNGALEVGTGTTGWTAFAGTGSNTISRNVTASNLASGSGSLDVSLSTNTTGGANNDLNSTALLSDQIYNVSFNIKSSSGTPTIAVQYYRNNTSGGTLDATCNVPTNGTVVSTSFFKYTCSFTTSGSGNTKATTNFLRISKTDAGTIAHIYIDGLAVLAQNTTGTKNTADLRVGGPLSQGLTLFTLDTFAGLPFTGTINQDLYGSMYYDTQLGRIQCYEVDGWGSCGAAPDSNYIMEPEYAGAVLNPGPGVDAHIGTMTANICSNAQSINSTICSSAGNEFNYYQWTTSQVTAQTYSIYVKYQLPPTFGGFLNSSTLQLAGRVTSTADASVAYSAFENDGSACGSSTNVTTSANTWQTVSYSTDLNTCTFIPGDLIMFRVDVSAKNNANAYAGRITFSMKGK